MTALCLDASLQRREMTVAARFDLEPAERLALFGPSGAGKTSILELIAGLVPPSRGSVAVDGRVIAHGPHDRKRAWVLDGRDRLVGLVRQPTTLFWHLSVAENLAYGAASNRTETERLGGALGLAGLARAAPLTLSGGQRQRVALGRALASRHKVLLLDEPFSAIDTAARGPLRDLVVGSTTERRGCAILVTHDLDEAQAFGSRLGVVDDGKIIQLGGAREVVLGPKTVRAAELVGYRGFLPAPDPRCCFALHPDRISEGAHPDRGVVLTGRVRSVLPRGARYECTIELAGAATAVVHLDVPPRAGEQWTATALDPPLLPEPFEALQLGAAPEVSPGPGGAT